MIGARLFTERSMATRLRDRHTGTTLMGEDVVGRVFSDRKAPYVTSYNRKLLGGGQKTHPVCLWASQAYMQKKSDK